MVVLCSNLSPPLVSPLINKNFHVHPERKLLEESNEPTAYQHISKMGPGTRYCKGHQAKSVSYLQFQMGWCSPGPGPTDLCVVFECIRAARGKVCAFNIRRLTTIDCQRIRSGNPCNSKEKCKLENHFSCVLNLRATTGRQQVAKLRLLIPFIMSTPGCAYYKN